MKEKKHTDNISERDFIMERAGIVPENSPDKKHERLSLLLHSCCGPCSTSVIERLAGEFNITVFFYNPCITDEAEYKRRRDSQIKFIEMFNQERMDLPDISFMEGLYEPGEFLELTKGHEEDPEGGVRCAICFRQRLEKAAQNATFAGCDLFGTTLTVSPHKNYEIISGIGKELAGKYGLSFLDRDFKKQDGFKRSIELSKKYELYRQNYCGCEYSKR
ncbi:MAG: epoxyqueuosine reductase QueH [Clostridia bacterium]|nr:epoxyqueuosine reductase QueH [Clostridia bacterium]